MNIEQLRIDPEHARELFRKYQEHRAYQTPHDEAIASIYKRIARGQTVIRALESIRTAGVDAASLPKLAIARADMLSVFLHRHHDGKVIFGEEWVRSNASKSKNISMHWPELPPLKRWKYEAAVPLIPVHLRPRRGLQNYHVLWEAEWTQRYPTDPYLLRRFGTDAWLVVAAWDLTEVERAVMAQRLNG